MKSCKSILQNIFNQNVFKPFFQDEAVIGAIFSAYRSKISLVRVMGGVLQIAVFDPRLVSHFYLIKNDIIQKFKEKGFSLDFSDIRFFFQKKFQVSEIHKKVPPNNVLRAIQSDRVTAHIKTVCKNQELHDLLYRLYVSSVKDREKYE